MQAPSRCAASGPNGQRPRAVGRARTAPGWPAHARLSAPIRPSTATCRSTARHPIRPISPTGTASHRTARTTRRTRTPHPHPAARMVALAPKESLSAPGPSPHPRPGGGPQALGMVATPVSIFVRILPGGRLFHVEQFGLHEIYLSFTSHKNNLGERGRKREKSPTGKRLLFG